MVRRGHCLSLLLHSSLLKMNAEEVFNYCNVNLQKSITEYKIILNLIVSEVDELVNCCGQYFPVIYLESRPNRIRKE